MGGGGGGEFTKSLTTKKGFRPRRLRGYHSKNPQYVLPTRKTFSRIVLSYNQHHGKPDPAHLL